MLSYRHAYHAGNHADVLKHTALVAMLDYLIQKEKPISYVDTHAGAGSYQFDTAEAQKTREYDAGIARLWSQQTLPDPLQRYRDIVRAMYGDTLLRYPGSPGFAAEVLREQDRLRLFELHPQDFAKLAKLFAADRRVKVEQSDGLAVLKSMLPPPSRRALVLIDPPYELADEYRQVLEAVKAARQRFAIGTYVVWYPLLENAEAKRLPPRLEGLGCESSLRAELRVRGPESRPDLRNGGLYGSGLFVINPPWTLAQQLREVLPFLAEVLKEDEGAGWKLDVVGD